VDATAIVLGIGIAGLLMLTFSGALARRKTNTEARLAMIDRRLRLVMDHLGVAEPEPETADIVAHLVAGRKIQAIKIYRDRTGAGLKEAKSAVEEMGRRHGI
jgi:ribosomal protein L7/L12